MTYHLLVRLKRKQRKELVTEYNRHLEYDLRPIGAIEEKQRKELVTVYNLHLEYDLLPIGAIEEKTKKRISHGIQPSSRV